MPMPMATFLISRFLSTYQIHIDVYIHISTYVCVYRDIFELIYTTASMEEKEKTIMAEDTRSSSMAATIIPIVIVVDALPFPANQVKRSDGTTMIIRNYQKYLQNRRLYLLEDIPNIYSI